MALLFALALGACARPTLTTGAECNLNSDCGEPLICGLERCRRQCIDSRDCGAGLLCLSVGALGGGCQLPQEARCTLTSECEGSLQCRFGTCTTVCAEDRDCPHGASCEVEPGTAESACIEPIVELCLYNTDCPPPLVCGRGQRCELECAEDRDCTRDRRCINNLCELPDGG